MINHQIKPHHLEKLAFVYLRQSSPTQVKRNVESGRRQRYMQKRVQELGWPASAIHVLGADTGRSGSSLHGRDDYQVMAEQVLAGMVGLIAARELSRLVRDNQDWNHLVRLCRYQDVLLYDEHRLYDATNPQDRAVLGVAGAFNELELAMIIDRMQESQRQKAARGELYEGRFSPGYVCCVPPLCEKHPDDRVQRAVMRVFDHFDRCVSVLQVHRELVDDGFQLAVVHAGRDWRDIEWVTPTYDQLLNMLKHPIYAGIYVRGRKQTTSFLNDQGHVQKKRRRVPEADWEVFLEDHHAGYISQTRWRKNLEKISGNARGGGAMKAAPRESTGLLSGILRCRRCGSVLHTQYPSGGVYYRCRGGSRQREPAQATCFGLPGALIEERVGELVREAVRPAAVAASIQAAECLARERTQRRQLLVDHLTACREAEARAAREYKVTDATYGAVRQRLAAEWEAALAAVELARIRLAAFDRDEPVQPTPEQRRELERLSEELHRIWFHPQVSLVLRKQVVRTMIEEIVIDLNEQLDELTLWVHWAGGHHTELQLPRHRRKPRRRNEDVSQVIDVLRKVLDDQAIAGVLNREKIRTSSIATWTVKSVGDYRRRHGIAAFSELQKREHKWLTGAEAANSLGISAMSVTRMIKANVLPAEQVLPGLPVVIRQDDLSLSTVKTAVNDLKSSRKRPLTVDSKQLRLEFPRDSS
jgi:DNA invertase Pin-like site-specific DNA recombinase